MKVLWPLMRICKMKTSNQPKKSEPIDIAGCTLYGRITGTEVHS